MGCPLNCRYCINKNVLSKGSYKEISVEELLSQVLLDYCYYVGTGGGVTFGGGESLLYADEICMFKERSPEGMNINAETSFNLEIKDEVFGKLDEFIIDIKTLKPQTYLEYTGLHNDKVIYNLKRIKELDLQDKCFIRIPIIPGFTTREDAESDAKRLRDMGFERMEIFDYVIRDYM